MGKLGLSEADVERIELGNVLLKVCCRIIRLCVRRGISVSLENPTSSRIFLCPDLARLLERPDCRIIKTVFCGYGTPWRKATTFAAWHFADLGILERHCSSVPCTFSHKPHQQLRGNGPGGVAWTRIAQPYPERLCGAYAKAARNRDSRALERYLSRNDTS